MITAPSRKMPRKYKPRPKLYTDAAISVAINEVEAGASLRSTAKKYHMSYFMLRQRCLNRKGLVELGKQGRKQRVPHETELKLATYIRRMADLGFGPTKGELVEIVHDYLEANNLSYLFNYKRPGDDWTSNFMKRHRLTLKKAGLMQIARKNVTSDPFVIYGFYDLLEAEVKRLGIEDRPECVWNLDESGFPSDPSRWKTVGPVGKKTVRVSCGANRENTTVLAVCCADGKALDPLIVFKGKNLMSNWRGNNVLPNTYYGVSDSGWMTTGIFHSWFEKFVEETRGTRPLLLLFDGHLTHTSASTIELAMRENISLVKLPAHCTDVLQPLDVACFNPLKSHYEKELTMNVHQTGAREPLRKADFGNLISKIWRKGLSEENIISGFRATGIFPVNASKYKVDRLDKVKLKTYKRWESLGKPVNEDGSPFLTSQESTTDGASQEAAVEPPTTPDPLPETSFTSPTSSKSDQSSARRLPFTPPPFSEAQSPRMLIRQLQNTAPTGMKYSITLVPQEDEISFEAVIKSRGRPSSAQSQPQKRHRISMHGAVLTDQEFLEKQIEKEQQKKKKGKTTKKVRQDSDVDDPDEMMQDLHEKQTDKRKTNKENTKTKQISDSDDSDSDSSSVLSDVDDISTLQKTINSALHRQEISNELPKQSEIKEDLFYAVYWDKPSTYYWGKVSKLFREDKDDVVNEVEMKFLKRATPSSNPSALRWDWPKDSDIDIVNVSHIIAGPTKPHIEDKVRGKQYYYFNEETQVDHTFKNIQKFGFPTS